ncbi:MAG TPA: hypothetical protein VF678_04190, partial [bacterium]
MKTKRNPLRQGRMRRQRRGTTAHNREFLVELVFRLLMRIGRGERLGVNPARLRAFVDACSQRYAEHPYHNWAHA